MQYLYMVFTGSFLWKFLVPSFLFLSHPKAGKKWGKQYHLVLSPRLEIDLLIRSFTQSPTPTLIFCYLSTYLVIFYYLLVSHG